MHLAALSNDPMGDLNPDCTYAINHRALGAACQVAKEAGVARYLFSSSCSLYGARARTGSTRAPRSTPSPPTASRRSCPSRTSRALADDDFSPTFLRNATAFGLSPRHRGDLVVNNLTAFAVATGEVLMKSDGTPWRPLVHIEDISRAFLAVLEAPRGGRAQRGLQRRAHTTRTTRSGTSREIVEEVVPDCRVAFAEGAAPTSAATASASRRSASRCPSSSPSGTSGGAPRRCTGPTVTPGSPSTTFGLALHAHSADQGAHGRGPHRRRAALARRARLGGLTPAVGCSGYQRHVGSRPRPRSHLARQPSPSESPWSPATGA